MKNHRTKQIALIGLMIICVSVFAQRYDRQMARDSLPGSIYFIGPDVSLDSLNQSFLYYSPDTGKTLYIRRSYEGDYALHNIAVSADASSGIAYMLDYLEGLYLEFPVQRSNNYGASWTEYDDAPCFFISSGSFPGELALSAGHWSTDFGESIYLSSIAGWTSTTSYSIANGNQLGMLWANRTDRYIFVTIDYGNSFDTLCETPDYGLIRRGHANNEAFIIGMDYLDYDTLYYSFDACTTFEERNEINLPGVPLAWDLTESFDRGWQQSEILCVSLELFRYEYHELRGGSIKVFISNDCGASWRLVAHHSSSGDAILEKFKNLEHNSDIIHITDESIFSDHKIYLYDIRGRLVKTGTSFSKRNLINGIYIAKTICDSKKILIYK